MKTWFQKLLKERNLIILVAITILMTIFSMVFFKIDRDTMVKEFTTQRADSLKNIKAYDVRSYFATNHIDVPTQNKKIYINVNYKNKLLTSFEDIYYEGNIYYSGKFDVKNVTWSLTPQNQLNINVYLNKVDYYNHEYIYPNKVSKFVTFTKYPIYHDTFSIYKDLKTKTLAPNVGMERELKNDFLFDKLIYKLNSKSEKANTIKYYLSYNYLAMIVFTIEIVAIFALLFYICWKYLKWKKLAIGFIIVFAIINVYNISFVSEKNRFEYVLTDDTELSKSKIEVAQQIIDTNPGQFSKAWGWGKGFLVDNRDSSSDVGTISNRWYMRRVSIWYQIWNFVTFGSLNQVHTPNISVGDHMQTKNNTFSQILILSLTRLILFVLTIFFAFKILEFFNVSSKISFIIVSVLALNSYFISYLVSIYWNGWMLLALFYISLLYYNQKKLWQGLSIAALCLFSFLNHNEHATIFLITPFLYPMFNLLTNLKEYKSLLKSKFISYLKLGCFLLISWFLGYIITAIVLWFRLKSFNINFSHISSAYGAIQDSLYARKLSNYPGVTIFTVIKKYYLSNQIGVFTLPTLFGSFLTQFVLKFTLLHHTILFVIMTIILSFKKHIKLLLINFGLFILPLFWIVFLPEHVYTEPWWNAWLSSFSVTFNLSLIACWAFKRICAFYVKDKKLAITFFVTIVAGLLIINTGFIKTYESNVEEYHQNKTSFTFNEQKSKDYAHKVAKQSIFPFRNSDFEHYQYFQSDETSDRMGMTGWQKMTGIPFIMSHNYYNRFNLFGLILKTNSLNDIGWGNHLKFNAIIYFSALIKITMLMFFIWWLLNIIKYLAMYEILPELYGYIFGAILMLNTLFMQYITSNYWLGGFIFGLMYYSFKYLKEKENRKKIVIIISTLLLIKFTVSFEHISAFGVALVIPFILNYIHKPTKERFIKNLITCVKFGILFVFMFILAIFLTLTKGAINSDLQNYFLNLTHIRATLNLKNIDVTKLNPYYKAWLMFYIDIIERGHAAHNIIYPFAKVTPIVLFSEWVQWFKLPFVGTVASIKYALVLVQGQILFGLGLLSQIFSKTNKMRLATLILLLLIPLSWCIMFNQHIVTEPYLTGWMFAIPFTFAITLIIKFVVELVQKFKNFKK